MDYEEVKEVTSNVLKIYKRSYCCRLFTYFFIKSFSYLLIFLTFLFLVILFLSLLRNAGIENLYIFGGFLVGLIFLSGSYVAG